MATDSFFDTNVLVYAFLKNDVRHETAKFLVASGGLMSVQVANEFIDVARRKFRWAWDDIGAMLAHARAMLGPPLSISDETHQTALALSRRYNLRIYDGLIVSAAKRAGCTILYTEDLQDGQVLDGVLVRNPFANA
jgi:predicted nucleic acid-binding protein